MTRRDRAALKAAMTMARKNPARARQLDAKLADGEDWQSVAASVSYSMQCETLKLRPWEVPPQFADAEYENSPGALALLRRMQRAGVSRFHPDPMRALAEAERAEAETPQSAA
jgi:hypothetical protein